MIAKQDKTLWKEVSARITTKVSRQDFNTLCELHSKYFNHKLIKPCTCNKKQIRMWITDLDSKLLVKPKPKPKSKPRKKKAANK